MSKKLPPISGIVAPTSPITVPSKAPSNILPELVPIPNFNSIRRSPIMIFDDKTSKPNIIKLDPIKNNSSKEKETPLKVINPSLDRSKLARPKTASKHGRRPPSKGGRKTRKETKSKKTRKNRKSKSKRKTRRTRRK